MFVITVAMAVASEALPIEAPVTVVMAVSAVRSVVVMLIESFRGPLLMSLQRARDAAPEMGILGTQEHEKFIEAVRRRDTAAASTIMREHLERTAHRLGH